MLELNEVFLNRMKGLLGDEYQAFLASLEQDNEKAIFVNQNKITVDNFKRIVDFSVSPIEYEKAGFYVGNEKKGRHALHHAGAFYMQEPSAMFTVNCHDFKGDEFVLDMCSAPGGKTIQLANRVPNGLVVSNEIVKSRSEILYSNIERMGLDNVIVANDTPEHIADAYGNCFDVCVVDAPCSGEGMFRKGQEMVAHWNENLNTMCAKRQLDILEEANKCLKQGGYLIYSTCTYALEENEEVVREFMSKHDYELINIEAPTFTRGIDMPEAVRLYPHVVKGEGQFVALLKKKEDNDYVSKAPLKLKNSSISQNFVKEHTKLDIKTYEYNNFSYYVRNLDMVKKGVNYVSVGVRLGEVQSNRFEPHHNFFTAFGKEFKLNLTFSHTDKSVAKYLKGETLDCSLKDGYGAVLVEGCALGGFKMSKEKFKNFYPKGLRNFK